MNTNEVDEININNKENVKKSLSLTKSYQNLNLKRNNFYQSLNTSYSTQTNPGKFNPQNDKENSNYQQNLNIYGEEQLFRTEEGRVIFRNGILNGIIKKYSDINNVVNKIQEILKKGAKFKIAYKASELGDKASVFKNKKTIKIDKGDFVRMKADNFFDEYELKEKLGEGAYGSVYKVHQKTTNYLRAVKAIKKKNVDRNEFMNEIEVLKTVDHPNIIKLFDCYYDRNFYYMVEENC